MTNTPLDFQPEFTPTEEERPAGTWMESYWAETARWAKYFSFAILGYFVWVTYTDMSLTFPNSNSFSKTGIYLIAALMIPLANIPVGFLSFFCFRFSQDLEQALAGSNQLLLEKAFRQLQRSLISGLVIATLWALSAVAQWQTTIQFMNQHVPPDHLDFGPTIIETLDTLN